MTRGESARRVRTTAAVRAGWGIALLAVPERVLGVTGGPVPAGAVVVARVLGVRHLVQAGANAVTGRTDVVLAGAIVDVLHAGSCLLAAAIAPGWRRVALSDAVVETGLAALDLSGPARFVADPAGMRRP